MAKSRATKKARKVKGSGNQELSVSRRARIFRFTKRFLLAFFAIIVFLPMALLVIYRIEVIHPVSTLMVRDWVTGKGVRREWIELQEMAPVVYQSILVSEDGRFCSHNGVDWQELNAVIEDAIDGERTRGASTITMQLAKNLFLWPDRSYVRKVLEIPYALMADLILGKQRSMEIYLNIVEMDAGVFGIEAASRHYFNRSSSKLGRRQASLLAVTLPNPIRRNAAKPSRGMNRIAKIIQGRARASGAYVKCLRSN